MSVCVCVVTSLPPLVKRKSRSWGLPTPLWDSLHDADDNTSPRTPVKDLSNPHRPHNALSPSTWISIMCLRSWQPPLRQYNIDWVFHRVNPWFWHFIIVLWFFFERQKCVAMLPHFTITQSLCYYVLNVTLSKCNFTSTFIAPASFVFFFLLLCKIIQLCAGLFGFVAFN